jgi:uncharacterized glyoxalase superfamily protein PhnB
MRAANPVPEGLRTVTPFLMVEGAARLIEFLRHAFAAEETSRTATPDGAVMHATVRIGDSTVEVADARGEWRAMPSALHLYVGDVDATYQRALRGGAASVYEPADRFYGDREAGVRDPCGNVWFIATHVEDVTPAEMERRRAKS